MTRSTAHKLRKLTLFATLSFAFALGACGGSKAPNVDRVKEDITSPSGSTKDKQSVVGAYSKEKSSSMATRLIGGNFVPAALSVQPRGLERLQPRHFLAPFLAQLGARAKGIKVGALKVSEADFSCFTADDLAQSNISGGGTSGSFSFNKSLSDCTAGELTGTLAIDADFTVDPATGRVTFLLEQSLTDVCETTGAATCVSGATSLELIQGGTDSGAMTAGWFLESSFTSNGIQREVQSKGGMRFAALGADQALEHLVYVKDSVGTEVNLVLVLRMNGEGTWAMDLRGSDGNLSCTVQPGGSGSCGGDLSWGADDLESLEANADLAGY